MKWKEKVENLKDQSICMRIIIVCGTTKIKKCFTE